MIAQRLELIMQTKNINQKELAKAMETSSGYISDVLSKPNKKLGTEKLESLKRNLNININWLIDGKGNMFLESEKPAQSTKLIEGKECANVPLFEVSAGGGINIDEFNTYPIPLIEVEKFKLNIADIAVAKVYGYSMEPLISENDYILVELNPNRIYNNEVYILSYENEFYCKRIIKNVTDFILKSDNAEFPPVVISGQEREKLNILGRVLYRMGTVAKVW